MLDGVVSRQDPRRASTGAGVFLRERRTRSRFLPCLVLLVLFVSSLALLAGAGSVPQAVPGEVLVRFSGTIPELTARPAHASALARYRSSGDADAARFVAVADRLGLVGVKPLLPLPTPAGARNANVSTVHRLVFAPDVDLASIIKQLAALPGVVYAEPNYRGSLSYAPTDPLWSDQSADLSLIGMESAWQAQVDLGGTAGCTSAMIVAVIDSGVEATHPDLQGVIHTANSYNFVTSDSSIYDDIGHGTRAAGIIGATANNAEGISGLATGCRVLSLDVADSSGVLTTGRVTDAVNYAVSHGAKVINMSLKFSGFSQALKDACDAAAAADVVLVAAAGNENQGSSAVYPACFESVMGVAAVMDDGTSRALFSNYNGTRTDIVDLAAPGLTVFSTVLREGYNGSYGSGTSYAAPMVAATAALLREMNPGQSAGAICEHLAATATPLGYRPGFEPDGWAGAGLLNAANALQTSMAPELEVAEVAVDDPTTMSAGNNNDGALDGGETIRLVVRLRNLRADAQLVSATLTTTDPAVTIQPGNAFWGDIPFGQNRPPAVAFVILLGDSAAAHYIPFVMHVVAGGGTYDVSLPFNLHGGRPVPIPPATHMGPVVWTHDNTYVVNGDQGFLEGLTIEPGTVIRVAPGVNLNVFGGAFSAEGTVDLPITFTSSQPPPAGPWGHLQIMPDLTSPTAACVMRHCTVKNGGGVVNARDTAQFEFCVFSNNAGIGLESNGPGAPVVGCMASHNQGNGFSVAPRGMIGCLAEWNTMTGMIGGALTDCTANLNGMVGMQGTSATDCSASSNTLAGIVASEQVLRCIARGNGEGIRSQGGVQDSKAVQNVGLGIFASGTGTVGNCHSIRNGDDGLSVSVQIVTNCLVDGNDGIGVHGNGSVLLSDSAVMGSSGQAVKGVASLGDCRIVRNGGGVLSVPQLLRTHVAENGGSGVSGGEVTDCTVIGNLAGGLLNPSFVSDSWVMYNRGIGIDTPLGDVTACSVRSNLGVGVRNLAGSASSVMNYCNLYDNGSYEYLDNRNDAPVPPSNVKDCRFNFWGGATADEMTTNPYTPSSNISRIYDVLDNGQPNGWSAGYGTIGEFATGTVPAAPGTDPPVFVLSVQPDRRRNVGVGVTTFTVTFSEPMNTGIDPAVTFGYDAPFDQHVVEPGPGWMSSTVWRGFFWVQNDTGDGMQTIRISKATDPLGYVIPDDTIHQFVIEYEGSLSANNGLALGQGGSAMDCSWTENDKPSGAKGYNISRSQSGAPGSYTVLNSSLLGSSSYADSGLNPETGYWYIVDLIDADNNTVQWTAPFYGTTESESAVENWFMY